MSITERIDNITKIPDDYLGTAIPIPQSVKIELTGRCNFKCSFCARSDNLRPQSDMNRGFFDRIVPEMSRAGVKELGLFYLGESFLCPWLPDAVSYAKQWFPYVFLTTNGSLANTDKVGELMNAGLDSLKFSFNYASSDQFTEIAGVKPEFFDKIIQNVKGAWEIRKENGYKTGLYASYIEFDGDQGQKMKEVIKQVTPYLDEVYSLPLYNQANFCTKKETERGWKPQAGNRGRIGNLRDPIPCWAVFTEGHITYDGKLSACCFDHANCFEMADLNKVGFVEGWNSIEFMNLRAAHLSKNLEGTACEYCVAYN